MSASCLKLVATFCLCCSALSGPGNGGVVWRDVGGAVTIQCRPPETGQDFLSLKKGLSEEDVFFVDGKSGKITPPAGATGGLQLDGNFPDMDLFIHNLTHDDTGPYWCKYGKYDSHMEVNGVGSVLLVVTDPRGPHRCEQPKDDLILVSLLICAAGLLLLLTGMLIWVVLKTKMCRPMKPQRVPGSDVYEDMRATIRR
ncbi:uncharacterized protein AB9W97_022199 [Spinachia spinachia]